MDWLISLGHEIGAIHVLDPSTSPSSVNLYIKSAVGHWSAPREVSCLAPLADLLGLGGVYEGKLLRPYYTNKVKV